MGSRRAGWLIDGCVVLQVVMILAGALLALPEWRLTVIGAVSALFAVAGWVAYRAVHRAIGLWVLLVAALMGTLGVPGLVSFLLALLALALIVFAQGLRAGIVAGLLTVVSLGVLIWLANRSLVSLLTQTVGNAVAVLLGVAGGLLLQQVRASVEVEKELMLANERSRSARELHDGLGHWLTLIAMNLEYAQRVRATDPGRAWEEIGNSHGQARDALAYMRRWVRALNPPREPHLVGTAAFEAIADSFRGTGLSVLVHYTGQEIELGREASLFAFRLVQEGLTNVLRHSTADEVLIRLEWGDRALGLELADNGGPVPVPSEGAGFGLRSLAERARELGGRFEVVRSPEGMVLKGWVPR